MMQAETTIHESEVQYVPDVACPNCGRLLNLPRDTYAWYKGNVTCANCQTVCYIEIGDYLSHNLGPTVPTTVRFENSRGGLLLRAPQIVEKRDSVPLDLVAGTESESIPVRPKRILRTAVSHFEERRYDDAAVRCRVLVEYVLEDQGIKSNPPSQMVDQAIAERLLVVPLDKYAQIIVAAGGQAAHPRQPISRNDALLVIGMAASLLRQLYEVDK